MLLNNYAKKNSKFIDVGKDYYIADVNIDVYFLYLSKPDRLQPDNRN